jgi:hypothetical protein
MNGTSYSKSEITIKPVDVKRNEVLDKLGIWYIRKTSEHIGKK